jgi:asparagine synthase (glutamine-hydrolysing)
MSQLFVVNGPDSGAVSHLFGRGLRAFDVLHGQGPADQQIAPGLAVAVFARTSPRAAKVAITRGPGGRWACAAGAVYPASAPRALLAPRFALSGGLRDVDGMFAVAIGDPAERRFAIATDRLGTLHVYRAEARGCLLVSTSSLVLAALAPSDWDLEGCREFLATGSPAEQRTPYAGIQKLAPATVLEFAQGSIVSRELYWDIAEVVQGGSVPRGGIPEVVAALRDTAGAIQREHRVPVYDLTSGYDSRAIVGAALREGAVRAVTVAGRDAERDVVVSRQIAERFGLEHVHARVDWGPGDWWAHAKRAVAYCDGEYDVLDYARVLAVHESLARRFDASVNGAMGEVLRGHWWNQLVPYLGMTGHFDARRVSSLRLLTAPGGADLLAARFEQPLAEHYADIVRRETARLRRSPNTSRMDVTYLMLRAQRWLGRSASASNRIWPVVSAWAFRAPLETALSMPFHARYGNRAIRSVIHAIDPALAAIPLENGYPAEPIRPWNVHRYWPFVGDVAWRVQRRLLGRPPLRPATVNAARALWAEEELRDVLAPHRMLTAGLYDEEKLRRMVESSRGDAFRGVSQLGRVVTLELLARAVDRARAVTRPAAPVTPEVEPRVASLGTAG